MESVTEIVIVSDSGTKELNCSMFDLESGNLIETYREGHSSKHGVDFIGHDYLISAFDDKPRLKIWQFGQNTVGRRITTPGIVSAIAVSKCASYCIAGIGSKIYIWEVATGNLESSLEYHVQDITCVKFSSDGSHFLSGGKDGMVFVFFLSDVIVERDTLDDVPKARYTWSDHAAEVTDIFLGCLGYYSRVVTASKDTTCRIYELDTGFHLCTVHANVPLTAVTMDICEYFLFLGSVEGDIYRINLFDMTEADIHFDDSEKDNIFSGHKKEVTSLCVSLCGKKLVSGSVDKDFKIWDITSFTCIRSQCMQGPVTNVKVSLAPPAVKNRKYMPSLFLEDFKRAQSDDDGTGFVPTTINDQSLSLFHAGAPDQFFDSKVLNCSTEGLKKMLAQGDFSMEDLSRINNEMYSFALNDVFVKDYESSD